MLNEAIDKNAESTSDILHILLNKKYKIFLELVFVQNSKKRYLQQEALIFGDSYIADQVDMHTFRSILRRFSYNRLSENFMHELFDIKLVKKRMKNNYEQKSLKLVVNNQEFYIDEFAADAILSIYADALLGFNKTMLYNNKHNVCHLTSM